MQNFTDAQKQILSHLKSFLKQREFKIKVEEVRDIGRLSNRIGPESYLYLEIEDYKFFLYEDGHTQVIGGERSMLNLEIEGFGYDLDKLELALFEGLGKLFDEKIQSRSLA